ncbi:nitroreductase family protein [Candidatus Bipolaricaulota bacterium]|nr:nitroreductase family protein [Candidatus Bipolaricaulota bacterium]MCF7890339.1 nitroreductase family protein [Candidatus Bipolaricaulota bacterium]
MEESPDREEDLNETILSRRSRRAISEEKLTETELETLARAAHLAPSCFNNQPWRFVLVEESAKLDRIKEALPGGNYWVKKAPLIIAVVSRQELDCELSHGRIYYKFDCGLAVENLLLQATEMGLVAHPIAGFDPEVTREVLNIPAEFDLITLLIIGKPGNPEELSDKHRKIELEERKRVPMEKVVSKNEFEDQQSGKET